MPPRNEPPWLTRFYVAVGLVLLFCIVGALFLAVAFWPITLLIAAAGFAVWWYYRSPWGLERRAREDAERLYEEAKRLNESATQFVDPEEVSNTLIDAIRGRKRVPRFLILKAIIEIAENIYRFEAPGPINPPPSICNSIDGARYRDQLSAYISTLSNPDASKILFNALRGAFDAYLDELPPEALQTNDELDADLLAIQNDEDGSAFSIQLADTIPQLPQAVQELIFGFFHPDVVKAGLLRGLRETLERKQCAASGLAWSVTNRESPRLLYPTTYGKLDVVQAFLGDTPLELLFNIQLPFELPPAARFRHQWVLGDTGAGKTTFISTMIAEDLERVARNECSLFIMDSQNELIPDIANLKVFAPGQPLHGRLIYLEPDPDFPLALNIFDVNRQRLASLPTKDRMIVENGAMWMVEFFLSSLVKAEATSHQDTFLNYIIPALMAIPDATIFTFKELLEPAPRNGPAPGYEKYKKYFATLRPDTQRWLAERMHSTELAVTRNAIRARLDGFTARGFFHDMFVNPRNKLDLFNELQGSKVILVNTMKGLLKSGTEPFGRYFIARLVQAMEERMLLDRGARLPVYAYLDEASDYIAEEKNIEELIDKARKQKMAFIFANQREPQITSLTVRDALSRSAIQARGEAQGDNEPPIWRISINRRPAAQIAVSPTSFATKPRMSPEEYAAMMRDMHARYYARRGEDGFTPTAPSDGVNNDTSIFDTEFQDVADYRDGDTAPKPWREK